MHLAHRNGTIVDGRDGSVASVGRVDGRPGSKILRDDGDSHSAPVG